MTIVDRVVAEIEDSLELWARKPFPTTVELGNQFDISPRSAQKVVRVLEEKGIVQCRRGKRPLLVLPKSGPQESSDSESADRFYAKLKDSIVQGKMRVGTPLPKRDYFAITERVSSRTISLALSRLKAEKLVYKEGRRWIVGNPSVSQPVSPKAKAPESISAQRVVFMMVSDITIWAQWFGWYRTTFFTSLLRELENVGIRFEIVLTGEYPSLIPFCSGKAEIRAKVELLGDRFLGFFLLERPVPGQTPDLKKWFSWLGQFGKPVVWFDTMDDIIRRPETVASVPKTFYRCCIQQEIAIEKALRALADHGHRRVAHPVFGPRHPSEWVEKRLALIESVAEKNNLPITILRFDQDEPLYDLMAYQDLEARLLGTAPPIPLSSLQNGPAEEIDYMAICERTFGDIKQTGATALICPNDVAAQRYYFLSLLKKIRIPEDLSMISFDNAHQFKHLPIATMGNGSAELGYLVAHLFIQDIPIQVSAKRTFAGTPELVNRGSLGKARR